jgi:hypothetical protein
VVAAAFPVTPRTNYGCAAWGCPNSGAINDEGEQRPGLCWWHFTETDRKRWGAVTADIKRNWATKRNHNGPGPQQATDPEISEADMFGDEVPA